MIRRPPRSTLDRSSAASDVYKRQDVLHPGHISALIEASSHTDFLVVGLNSDASVTKLKGEGRPVNKEPSRSLLLAALSMVDAVVTFSEDTPLQLIKAIMPDVLVKGGDYKLE